MSIRCAKCPLRARKAFKSLSDDDLAFMERFKTGELHVEAGTPVVVEGSKSPHFHTVLSGAALRTKLLADGRRQGVNFVFPGDLVGLQSSLLTEMAHGVEAVTDMRLCIFSRERLWELFRSSPARAFDLTWLAATEERSLGEMLLSAGRRDARERVAALLLYLGRRAEESAFSESRLETPFPFRQQDLADAAGLSLVHTNKMLQSLRAARLIRIADGMMTILDEPRLKEAAMSDEEPGEHGRPLL